MDAMQAVQAGDGYGHPVQAMMYWLRQATRELREEKDRKQVHIAAGGNLDQSTVNRFESGQGKPRDLDAVVRAYAEDLDMQPVDIWAHALELWRASELNDADALEQDEEQADLLGGASDDDHGPSGRIPGQKR
jgi:transcriptional regulator with XRE-family HTH domain